MKKDGYGVVRFGAAFYVVPICRGQRDVHDPAKALARFPFTGPPVRVNADCLRAFEAAKQWTRTTFTQKGSKP